jgi:hypothetical protein
MDTGLNYQKKNEKPDQSVCEKCGARRGASQINDELLNALKACLVFVDKYRTLSAGDGDIAAMNARFIISKAEGEN